MLAGAITRPSRPIVSTLLAALALEVGFADASSFSRAFKSHFNETPGRIRQLHQGLS